MVRLKVVVAVCEAESVTGPFVVRDDAYVSARWPGDAFTFAQTFAQVLAERT